MVAPVEDIIVDGQLVGGVRCEPTMRVSGTRRGDDLFLPIADYHSRERRGYLASSRSIHALIGAKSGVVWPGV